MRVSNMTSRNGNKIANQFVITSNDGNVITFQSYESEIATINWNKRTITIGRDWDYSTTTGKYRNLFFDEYFNILNTKKAIALFHELMNEEHKSFYMTKDGHMWTIIFE
jgi:hypothetical protein